MSAGKFSVSLIVLSVLPGVFAKVDNCDGLTTKEGYIDCVSFPTKYKDSQWAVCASQREISRNIKYRCHGSFCWLPCMGITTGRKRGMVSQKCRCKSSDWKIRPIQTLNLNCYLPSSNDCTWFTNCLSKYKDCPESSNTFAYPFAQYLCSVFDSNSDHLSASGNRYIRSLRDCLQREMFHLIFPSSNQTCTERKDIAQKAHDHCFNLHILTLAFSDLPVNDQSYIFWTLRSVVINTFGSLGRNMLDKLRNCYHGNVQSVEKQVQITIDAEKGVLSTVDVFANMLKWPSMGVVWDAQILPQISVSIKAVNILFKPKVDFDFTISRQSRRTVNMNNVYKHFTTELSLLNLKQMQILDVSLRKEKMEYFPSIGKCPLHNGGKIFNNLYPESLETINIQMVLYRMNISKETLNYFIDDSIKGSSYDSDKHTYFIIHGFIDYGEKKWVKKMVDTFLQNEDCNVVVVDWYQGADIIWDRGILNDIFDFVFQDYFMGTEGTEFRNFHPYLQAVVNTRLVGCFVGKFVEKLANLMRTNYKDVHIIGHSLGAHVAGFAGLYTKGKIGRITGLDPAGPSFGQISDNFRLDQNDANFVDIIHTDTDFFGINIPTGHIDFYPNGGYFQPGCLLHPCDHKRAYSLFTASISPTCIFRAYLCSWEEFDNGNCNTTIYTEMGLRMDQSKRGSFSLKTSGTWPFCTD